MADFLVIAGVFLAIPRGQAERQPDGFGKWRWSVTTIPLTRADEAAVLAAIGAPDGSESDRALDGTLHTTRPLVTATGEAFGAAEGASGTVQVEVTLTGGAYRHTTGGGSPFVRVAGGAPATQRTMALTLREA